MSEGREKIELLLQYAEQMPGLPEHIQEQHDSDGFCPGVHDPGLCDGGTGCERHAFLLRRAGRIPHRAGLCSHHGNRAGWRNAPEQVLNIPNDFYQLMGLEQVLTMQRLNGISAILAHMKRIALQSLQGDAG